MKICCKKKSKILIYKNNHYEWHICSLCLLISNNIFKKKSKNLKDRNFDNSKTSRAMEFQINCKKYLGNIKMKKKMLDFGCGQGDNLIQAKELGFIVHGVEPNDFRRKNCKKKGLRVFKNLNSLKKNYNFLYSRNVFDFVDDFPKTFRKYVSLLKNEGYILIVDKSYDFRKRKISIYKDNKSFVLRNVLLKQTILHHCKINNLTILKTKFRFNGVFEIFARKDYNKKNFIEKPSLSFVEKFLKETKGNIFSELKYSFFEQIVIFQRGIRKAIILIKQFGF